jgi:hypothetical protein
MSGSSSYMAGYNAMTNQANSRVTAAYDFNGRAAPFPATFQYHAEGAPEPVLSLPKDP